MSQTSIIPYLFFSGRCEEALDFYEAKLGAKIGSKMRHHESPDAPPPGMLQAGFENKIMHADFFVKGVHLMASDGCDDKSTFSGFRLALIVPDEAEAQATFQALTDGGNVDMPLGPTFWSPCFGMVTDKFQVGWMVMVPGIPPK